MATVSGLRFCPACGVDLSGRERGALCPVCKSDAAARQDRRKDYIQKVSECGFDFSTSFSTQLHWKSEQVRSSTDSEEEKEKKLAKLRSDVSELINEMPAELRIGLMADVITLLSHSVLRFGTEAKVILEMGMKIGKLCENLDQYTQIKFRKG